LRKENSGRIKQVAGLWRRSHRGVEFLFFGKLFGACGAARQMRFDQLALVFADFLANVKYQERRNVFAARVFLEGAHRKPPNSLRSLRVARNNEFFTVSSVVPSTSPMARSFRP